MIFNLGPRRIALGMIAAAAVAFSTPAMSQEIADSHVRAARQAISAIGATDDFDMILPGAAASLKAELLRKDPHLQSLINRTVDENTIALAARRADLEREAALVYARAFTEQELNEIAAFYSTEAGKKLIERGPLVTRQIIEAAEIWQNGIARDLAETVAAALEAATESGQAN